MSFRFKLIASFVAGALGLISLAGLNLRTLDAMGDVAINMYDATVLSISLSRQSQVEAIQLRDVFHQNNPEKTWESVSELVSILQVLSDQISETKHETEVRSIMNLAIGLSSAEGLTVEAMNTAIDDVVDRLDLLAEGISADGFEMRLAAEQEISRQWQLVGMIGVLALGLSTGLAFWLVRPLHVAVKSLSRIVHDDVETPLDANILKRTDEIGEIARAVGILREQRAEGIRLEAARSAEHSRRLEEGHLVADLANSFGQQLDDATTSMSEAADRLSRDTALLRDLARHARVETTSASSATDETNAVISGAADAMRDLSASITQIGQTLSNTSQIASQAVEEALRTTETVAALSSAAQRIGDVVKLINTIAGQTNLLALNATIEAARAGEAGRGFAVVAGEVKNLATETERATGDIQQQVQAIQKNTDAAVSAISDISRTLGRMAQISVDVSAVMSTQDNTARTIAERVIKAADSARATAINAQAATRHVEGTEAAAERTAEAVQEMTQRVKDIRADTQIFVSLVASRTP